MACVHSYQHTSANIPSHTLTHNYQNQIKRDVSECVPQGNSCYGRRFPKYSKNVGISFFLEASNFIFVIFNYHAKQWVSIWHFSQISFYCFCIPLAVSSNTSSPPLFHLSSSFLSLVLLLTSPHNRQKDRQDRETDDRFHVWEETGDIFVFLPPLHGKWSRCVGLL